MDTIWYFVIPFVLAAFRGEIGGLIDAVAPRIRRNNGKKKEG